MKTWIKLAVLLAVGVLITAAVTRNIRYAPTFKEAVTLESTLAVTGASTFTGAITAAGGITADITAPNEVATIQCVADSSDSLNETYFLLSSRSVDYYIWFDSTGSGSDPSVASKTGAEVTISTDDTANTVAAALQVVLDALEGMTATVSTDTVTVTFIGGVTDVADSSAAATGFTFTVSTDGETMDVGAPIVDYVVQTGVTRLAATSNDVADDGTITIETGVAGVGWVMAGDNEEFAPFRFTSAGVVTLLGDASTNTANTDSDTDLCVYDGGAGIILKNRLGAAKDMTYVIDFFTP